MVLETAQRLKTICDNLQLPLIFKSSFDKANRTSASAARGVGMAQGLKILARVREQVGVPVLTDVHLPASAAAVAEVADVLQIPAFLCRQTDLIVACAKTGRAMNIKKGQFLSPFEMPYVVDKARQAGCENVLVCERGSSFGYQDLVVDMRALVWLRQTQCPVVFDATHAVQQPGAGGGQSGGVREMVPALARAAVAVGVNGIFIETHPNPPAAISDSATQWHLDKMEALLASLLPLHTAHKA